MIPVISKECYFHFVAGGKGKGSSQGCVEIRALGLPCRRASLCCSVALSHEGKGNLCAAPRT